MTSPNLVLVRHCQATGQEPDAPLTETGHQQAQTLADFLSDYPIDHVTTSEYLRARKSIEPFASISDLPVHTDLRLNERTLSYEPLENWQDVVRDSFDDLDLCAPGGESARKVLARAWAALNEIIAAGHSLPLVVTHGNLMALVLHSLDGTFGFEGWRSLSNPDVFLLSDFGTRRMAVNRIWQLS
ncbi:MAG: histidine phosphatase family protein [Chloroflexi bacterium]|nr:histidine phosphatase family protein [Chloroflexota bacterium]